MENGIVTTPFGRRSMTLGMLKTQVETRSIAPEARIDKWKLFRALCEARVRLGVSDRALSVVNALLSFYPKAELCGSDGLVVFPSNAQLSLRTHGMAETTLRRHLSALVGAGLLIRKDSPNGKRYARKDRAGEIDQAFGFSLAPLVSRSDEIVRLAGHVVAERQALLRLRERLTLCRRDVAKLVEAALEERVCGNWLEINEAFRRLSGSIARKASFGELTIRVEEMEAFRKDVINRLETQVKLQKSSGNPSHFERHIQNSKPDSYFDSEPSFETKQGAILSPGQQTLHAEQTTEPLQTKDDGSTVASDRGGHGKVANKSSSHARNQCDTVEEPAFETTVNDDLPQAVLLELFKNKELEHFHASAKTGNALDEPGITVPGLPATGSLAAIEASRTVFAKIFPLGMVLGACPQIGLYGPGGTVCNWRDLMAAAVVVRSMLGVSASAYQEACEVMGPENAATLIACILERAGHITSAGGYLRDLTRRARRQKFSIGPLLMAQLRIQHHQPGHSTA